MIMNTGGYMIRSSSVGNGKAARWTLTALSAIVLASAASCTGSPDDTADSVDDGDASEIPEAGAQDLAIALTVPQTVASAGEQVPVTATLTNIADHPVRVLKRNTPLDGIKEDLFTVSRDGVSVAYLGRHYKWAAPQPEDFVTLDPQQSVSHTVDIATAYDLSITATYNVQYGEATVGQQLTASTVSIRAEGRPFSIPEARIVETSEAGLTTVGCSSQRSSQLSTAYSSARSMASAALSYLTNTTPSNTLRYRTWFGTFSASRWNTAKAHYASIRTGLNNEVADCTCTDSAYAFVYPSRPYTIHLCNAFWPAPNTGTDSKAGTLIHEMSHFNVIAATDDNAYGQTACKRLATTNPSRALDNADSHEYFAENTPFQQ
jgi:peptidyl-Lys metalloendopeptidase